MSKTPAILGNLFEGNSKCVNFKFVLSVCSEEPMIPDEHDEVDLNDFDPKVCIYF
jgi:hypothetical protein